MTDIALFHSVLGVRPGVREAADRLRAEGHDVVIVDQYYGRVFDDYDEADEFAQSIGYPTLMGLAEEAVQGVPDGFIAAGFSNGGGMAEFVATKRLVRGVLMLSGALDLARLGWCSSWCATPPVAGTPGADSSLSTGSWGPSAPEAGPSAQSMVEHHPGCLQGPSR